MEQFASGWKRHYYGKGDVIVYRLNRGRDARSGQPVFGANVLMLVYGDAFWPTYTTGDNTNLIATDSMKNFIQRETLGFDGDRLEPYCRYLAKKFLQVYSQVEGIQVSAEEIPYAAVGQGAAFAPAGPERRTAQIEIGSRGILDVVSGLRGFKLLRLGGSAFHGFVRDEYTTLPDLFDRPLHIWLDLEWRYTDPEAAFGSDDVAGRARQIVREVFESFESGSIQQVVHQMGTRLLNDLPVVAEIHLEANNRTWDTIAEHAQATSVYTDPRPPYGCVGLRLRR